MTVSRVPLSVLGLAEQAPVARRLRRQLAAVDLVLYHAAGDPAGLVDRSAPPFAGHGVRLHAALALLGGARAEPGYRPLVTAAAAVELTHLATRYHDEVVEGTGRIARQHNTRTVLAGDLLIVRATALAGQLPAPALRLWTAALGALHEGRLAGRPDDGGPLLRAAAVRIGAAAIGSSGPAPPVATSAASIVEAWISASAAPAVPAAR